MKQATLHGGEAIVEEVPAPCLTPGQVLVKVEWSCVNPGTELASADRMRAANILERFHRDPMRRRRAFDILLKQGPKNLLAMTKEQLSVCMPSGYSCAGVVLAADSEVTRTSLEIHQQVQNRNTMRLGLQHQVTTAEISDV